jgi:lipid-A-disaccharide synthase
VNAPANRSGAPLKLILCAVEPSGDALGAELINALRVKSPDVEIFGCGGVLMKAAGLESLFPIDPFSVIGPIDALKALPAAYKAADALARETEVKSADAVILIDGWSFAHIAAKKVKQRAPGVKLIKYVAPQVWASRPHRAKTVAALFDGVLTLFAFEPAWFEKEGVRSKFVGHSTFQAAAQDRVDGAAFRQRHGLADGPLLAVLPGSRHGEVRRLMEPFRQTVETLRETIPDMQTVIVAAPAVEAEVRKASAHWPGGATIVGASERYQAYSAATAGLVASGTVTTELAIFATPMVVGYRVDWASALWVRRVATIRHASMINIAADAEIIPEFLQEDCKPEAMAAALIPLLTASPARRAQLEAFPELLQKFGVGGPPAAALTAETILEWTTKPA